MKILRFAIKDIISALREHLFLVLVIMLGITTALVTHLVTFGFLEREVLSKKSYSQYNTVSAINIDCFDDAQYRRIVERNDVENAFCCFKPENEDYLLVGWLGSTPQTWFPIGEGIFLSDALVDKPAYVSGNLGVYRQGEQQKLTIMGEEYYIVGSTFLLMENLMCGLEPPHNKQFDSVNTFVFINLEELINMDLNDAFLRVHFKYDPDQPATDFEKAAEEIFAAELLSSKNIFMPPSPIRDFMIENIIFFVSIGLLCLLAYMNIIAMYWHLLSTDSRNYHICSIVGANSKALFALVFIKYLVLYASAAILSVIITIAARPLFALIKIEYVLNFKTLGAVFLFNFATTLLVSLPKMIESISIKNFRKKLLRRGNG